MKDIRLLPVAYSQHGNYFDFQLVSALDVVSIPWGLVLKQFYDRMQFISQCNYFNESKKWTIEAILTGNRFLNDNISHQTEIL